MREKYLPLLAILSRRRFNPLPPQQTTTPPSESHIERARLPRLRCHRLGDVFIIEDFSCPTTDDEKVQISFYSAGKLFRSCGFSSSYTSKALWNGSRLQAGGWAYNSQYMITTTTFLPRRRARVRLYVHT